jgi:hypothetical protein
MDVSALDLRHWPEHYRAAFVGNMPANVTEAEVQAICEMAGVAVEVVHLFEVSTANLRAAKVIVKDAYNLRKLVQELHGHLSDTQFV